MFPSQTAGSGEGGGWSALLGEDLSQYQSLAASLNGFALDRLVMMFDVEELMRKLSSPEERDTIMVDTDADHARCLRSRKSISGGVIVWNKAILNAWSRTQALIAPSFGESELAAVTKAAT